MTPFLVALVATVLGLFIQLVVLWRRDHLLRSKEQAYRFHELRDRLQLLNAQCKVQDNSISYKFLMSSLNLAIRNAGTMKLSDVLQISRAVRRKAEDITFEQIAEDTRQHGEELQALSAEFFRALTMMLISNDNLTSFMFTLTRLLASFLNQAALRAVASVGKALDPERTEAVYEARQYQHWGQTLSPSY